MQPNHTSHDSGEDAGLGANDPSDLDVASVRRFRAGQPQGLVEILHHEHAVRRLIAGMLGDVADVDDLTQDVFVRLIEHLPRMTAAESLRPWLYRTALNRVRDHLRRRRVRKWFSLGRLPELELVDRAEERADKKIERDETVERLRVEIRRLRPAHREVVVLRDLIGLSPTEAGEVLGIAPQVVNDRLYRARRELARRC